MGVSEKSALWGAYISRLDNTLRGLLNDLAVTRVKRKRLDKDEALLVSIDEVLMKFVRAEPRKRVEPVEARRVVLGPRRLLLASWRRERRKLSLTVRRGEVVG